MEEMAERPVRPEVAIPLNRKVTKQKTQKTTAKNIKENQTNNNKKKYNAWQLIIF